MNRLVDRKAGRAGPLLDLVVISSRWAGICLQVRNVVQGIVVRRICAPLRWGARQPSRYRGYGSVAVHGRIVESGLVETTASIGKVTVVIWIVTVPSGGAQDRKSTRLNSSHRC